VSKNRHKGDFEQIDAEYPECTRFVTSDVTLDVQGQNPSQINATIELYGLTPNGEQRYLLTVWDSGVSKPMPKPSTVVLGTDQIGEPARRAKRKTKKK
jgi:hypothetical protein